jgi:HSP20 family molecular chaperone IbpA
MTTQTIEKHTPQEAAALEHTRCGYTCTPAVDIYETKDQLTLLADLPGVRGEDIQLNFEKGELSISAKVAIRQPEGAQYLLAEYGMGDFYRSFRISEEIDSSRISAQYKDGVLTLHLPKVEAVKPRRIAVKTA